MNKSISLKNTISFLLFIFVNQIGFAQNYKPIYSNTAKLYQDTGNALLSLRIQSDTAIAGDSIYCNYFELSNDFSQEQSACPFWGSACNKQNAPSWIGKKIVTNNLSKYYFFNQQNDTLSFDFNTLVNDTNLVYQDNIQQLKMYFKSADTLTILGVLDSIHRYRLIHQQLNGTPVNSIINEYEIIIGKQFGLCTFLNVKTFPNTLNLLHLVGNHNNPVAGITRFTNEMVYDFAVGDIYQWKENGQLNTPPYFINRFRTIKILSKTITTDSIFYSAEETISNNINLSSQSTNISLRYRKIGYLAGFPYEAYNGDYHSLFYSTNCNVDYLGYSTGHADGNAYCALDSCWGGYDTGGPPISIGQTYFVGLGMSNYSRVKTGSGGFYEFKDLVYFKKNSVECGIKLILSANNLIANNSIIKVYPQPALNSITIESTLEMKSISLFDIQGYLIKNNNSDKSAENIDVSELKSGIYFAVITFKNNLTYYSKIVLKGN